MFVDGAGPSTVPRTLADGGLLPGRGCTLALIPVVGASFGLSFFMVPISFLVS
jgi:hypothetical protein